MRLPRHLGALLWTTSLPFLLILLVFSQQAAAATILLDFESFPDSTILADQYSSLGVNFQNTITLAAGISLNEFELPPHSGQNVASDNGGPISISFTTSVLSFSGYFTYYEPVTVEAFDSSSNQVDTATSLFSINVACDPGPVCLGDPGSSPNELLSVSSPAGISSVTITGDPGGGSFVVDDVALTSAAPEPSGLVLSFPAALLIAGVLRVQRHIHHTNRNHTMKKMILPSAGTIVLILGLGAIWLYAGPRRLPPTAPAASLTKTPPVPHPTRAAALAQTHATALATSNAHSIGTLTISPPSIAASSTQPVIITAQITDPALLKGSVNLLQLMPTGQAVVIGQLGDNGTNGDLVANDNIYSISESFSSLPVGTAIFRISAAFAGSLTRVLSPNFSLIVSQTTPTNGWTALTDSEGLFSISVPAEWGLTTSDVRHSDPDTLDSIIFSFPNGATAFIVSEHTQAGWIDLQNNGFTAPVELGQHGGYVFGWSEPPDRIGVSGFTDGQIRLQYDTIRSTFRLH